MRTGNGMPGGPGGDTGDPIEPEVHEMSVAFHDRLDELGIAHVWDDYGAGGHTWFYWQRDLRQLMPTLRARLRQAARAAVAVHPPARRAALLASTAGT